MGFPGHSALAMPEFSAGIKLALLFHCWPDVGRGVALACVGARESARGAGDGPARPHEGLALWPLEDSPIHATSPDRLDRFGGRWCK